MWSILSNKTRPLSCDGAVCFGIVVLSHLVASAGTTNLSRSGMPIRAANQSTNAGSSGGNRVIYGSDKKVAHRNSCIRIRLSFCLDGYIRPFPVFPSPLSFSYLFFSCSYINFLTGIVFLVEFLFVSPLRFVTYLHSRSRQYRLSSPWIRSPPPCRS